MRDYTNFERYINELYGDIYEQPEDAGHTRLARKVIDSWMSRMSTCQSVLDVGAGQGMCQEMFERWNKKYEGVSLGEDVVVAQSKGRNIKAMDFTFLEYPDQSFDLIFARHSLEHSPFPVITLKEWRRVSKQWLGIILPAPEWYTYTGKNHYSVMNYEQIENLLAHSGWGVLWNDVRKELKDINDPESLIPNEYWIMCEKRR